MSRKELYNQSGRMIDVNSEQGSKDFYTRFFAGFCLIISFDASWMRENVVSASLLVPPSLVQSSNNVFYIYIDIYAHTHTRYTVPLRYVQVLTHSHGSWKPLAW